MVTEVKMVKIRIRIRTSHYFQKYTGPDYLAESVIIGNVPYFAISNARTGDIKLEKSIPIADGGDLRRWEWK